ncbi:MAG TPA: nucleoside triphosphate pyrophosphohydrolase [Vicinamibacterales bacterium]|nr:nucleoside triphosphate pyrophosphohydrolase [Vicinamibacterales bacterium]
MATLRSPDGCPWDRAQTIDSLKPFVLEETYEVLEAIDRHDHAALCEELGDFLFEAVFLAQLESEAGHFTIEDSLKSIADKLVRRHPHVFARDESTAGIDTPDKVVTRWEEIKAQERAAANATAGVRAPKKGALLSGLPAALPALLRAYEIGIRAKSVGFDWERVDDVLDKIQEEVDELREVVSQSLSQSRATPSGSRERMEEEMGDLLFTLAHLSRQLGIEPETALRKANDKFTKRFETMESAVDASGRKMSEMTLDELEVQWQMAKAQCVGDDRQ